MTDRIQLRLENETLSPVVAAFLRILLQLASLLEQPASEQPALLESGYASEEASEPALPTPAVPEAGMIGKRYTLYPPSPGISSISQDFPANGPPAPVYVTIVIPNRPDQRSTTYLTMALPNDAVAFDFDVKRGRFQAVYVNGNVGPLESVSNAMYNRRVEMHGLCSPHRDMLTGSNGLISYMDSDTWPSDTRGNFVV